MPIQRIFFFVPPGVHLLDLTGPAQVFYTLQSVLPGIKLHYLKVGIASEIKSSAGLQLGALEHFTDYSLTEKDIVFIPGLDPQILLNDRFLNTCRPLFKWLKEQLTRGAITCSVCTGAFLLAAAGILEQRECTTHWNYLERFKQRFPKAHWLDHRLFVRDKNVYTSAGVTSGIDLSLHIIEDLVGARIAADIARDLVVYLRRSSHDPQLSIFLRYRNHLDESIHAAQDYLAQQLSGDCSLTAVAAHINMSQRNLSRRFKQYTGLSVGAYLELIRVEKANQLIAEGEQMNVVASAIGLKSTNQVRNLIQKHKGLSARELKRTS